MRLEKYLVELRRDIAIGHQVGCVRPRKALEKSAPKNRPRFCVPLRDIRVYQGMPYPTHTDTLPDRCLFQRCAASATFRWGHLWRRSRERVAASGTQRVFDVEAQVTVRAPPLAPTCSRQRGPGLLLLELVRLHETPQEVGLQHVADFDVGLAKHGPVAMQQRKQ